MRKYALVILDNRDEIIDRYNLDIITEPKGNGFELELSTLETDLEDIITKVKQKKNIISFTVQQIHESYQKANLLANWIQRYSTPQYTMALEYDDGVLGVPRYCEGKVVKLEKNEKVYNNVLQQNLEFKQTTPYYIRKDNALFEQKIGLGKSYPYKYPFAYGSSEIKNNDIKNPYLLDVPLIIIIDGLINNPTITLYNYTIDENGNEQLANTYYNRVEFLDNVSIAENEQLVINSAQRKIYKYVYRDNTKTELINTIDFVNQVSPTQDTFIRANSGNSKIFINTDLASVGEGFKMVGSWRQYLL